MRITVRDRDQVMLKVTVAEVQRDVIKQLGVDLSASVAALESAPPWSTSTTSIRSRRTGQSLSSRSGTASSTTWQSINATLKAMERAGVIRTLAEPNLTAISGETATFMAGGEFPIPAGYTCATPRSGHDQNCQPQIQCKKFGVSLNFTPVVLSRRPHQPQGDDGSVRSLERERADLVQSTGSILRRPRTSRP